MPRGWPQSWLSQSCPLPEATATGLLLRPVVSQLGHKISRNLSQHAKKGIDGFLLFSAWAGQQGMAGLGEWLGEDHPFQGHWAARSMQPNVGRHTNSQEQQCWTFTFLVFLSQELSLNLSALPVSVTSGTQSKALGAVEPYLAADRRARETKM